MDVLTRKIAWDTYGFLWISSCEARAKPARSPQEARELARASRELHTNIVPASLKLRLGGNTVHGTTVSIQSAIAASPLNYTDRRPGGNNSTRELQTIPVVLNPNVREAANPSREICTKTIKPLWPAPERPRGS